MKSCNSGTLRKSFLSRAFLIFGIVSIFTLVCSANVFCYDMNGTATGNILNNGYAAVGGDFSVYADTENGYALTVERNGKTVVADKDNAQYLNVVDRSVYYITVDGEAHKTILRCYDVDSNRLQDIYTVPLAEGMKNLYVQDGAALLQSDGNVVRYDLNSGKTDILLKNVTSFVPVDGGILYTAMNGSKAMLSYHQNENDVLLAEDVASYDTDGEKVYFSDGENGVYRVSLAGGESVKSGNGGWNIVCSEGEVYWQNNDKVVSYDEKKISLAQAVENDTTSFSVLNGSEVAAVAEEIGEGGSAADSGSSYLSAVSPSAGMPAMDNVNNECYKNWKQTDKRWSGNALGSDTIGRSGCVATSISILLVGCGAEASRYLKGTFDPGVFVKEMTNNGGFTSGGGIYWQKVTSVYPSFEYKSDNKSFGSLSASAQAASVTNHSSMNNYMVLQVPGRSHYVAADYAVGSTIYMCDPGSSRYTKLSDYGERAQRAVVYHYTGEGWSNYLNKAATPVITSVDVAAGKQVTITCGTSGASIYYTTDGSTPTANSLRYTGSFILEHSATVQAVAIASGYDDSFVASSFISTWDDPFKDLNPKEWYYSEVAMACEEGLFHGYDDNTFRPKNNMTRAEFVRSLFNFLELDSEYDESPFSDVVVESWYEESVIWAYSNGIVAGTSDTTFSPATSVTREQVCSLLVRFAKKYEITLSPVNSAVTFKDAKKISSYAKDDISVAQQAGLIYGDTSGNFNPQGKATRAEVAAIMVRFLKKM